MLGTTAESPLGPFYPLHPPAESDADLTRLAGHANRARGTVIELTGRVRDLRGNPIAGAQMELWQANAAGRYTHELDPAIAPLDPDFQSYARLTTGADGAYRIVTIKPGGYDSPIGHRPRTSISTCADAPIDRSPRCISRGCGRECARHAL